MIVELFGPAGAGKTTLAQAAADALRNSGRAVHVASSARPSETDRAAPLPAVAARVRKVMDLAPLLKSLSTRSDETATIVRPLLPNANVFWRLRFLRYLARLDEVWMEAKSNRLVTIFDQGYISALGAVFLRNQSCSRAELAQALSKLPNADVTIYLSLPIDITQKRLMARLAGQTWAERLLELDPGAAGRQSEVFTTLASLLADQGRAPAPLSSINSADLARCAQEIVGLLHQADRKQRLVPDDIGMACEETMHACDKARFR